MAPTPPTPPARATPPCGSAVSRRAGRPASPLLYRAILVARPDWPFSGDVTSAGDGHFRRRSFRGGDSSYRSCWEVPGGSDRVFRAVPGPSPRAPASPLSGSVLGAKSRMDDSRSEAQITDHKAGWKRMAPGRVWTHSLAGHSPAQPEEGMLHLLPTLLSPGHFLLPCLEIRGQKHSLESPPGFLPTLVLSGHAF